VARLKEVIRPQVPLRTPCYNLARLAKLGIARPRRERAHPNLTRLA